jgi:hypothetical protein
LGLTGSSSAFVLPKLGNFPGTSEKPSMSLLDFANDQLKNLPKDNTGSAFKVPNLFPKREAPTEAMKNLQLSPSKVVIDLQSALVPENEQKKLTAKPIKKPTEIVENFIPKFVDCDRVASQKEIEFDEHCERITLAEITARYKNCPHKKFSAVGRIIRKKFSRKCQRIHHGYEFKHQVTRFAFDTPSPDDKILAHLNKH